MLPSNLVNSLLCTVVSVPALATGEAFSEESMGEVELSPSSTSVSRVTFGEESVEELELYPSSTSVSEFLVVQNSIERSVSPFVLNIIKK